MTELLDLYCEAEMCDIDVDWFTTRKAASMSARLPDGSLCIAMDPWKIKTIADERIVLAHELGHCETGSFYNLYATCDIRKKHENRADKWAIEKIVDEGELNEAIAEGHYEIWDLAEHFGVTEEFMKKAVCWYKYGNLATEYYM